jgi:hypothetical protein
MRQLFGFFEIARMMRCTPNLLHSHTQTKKAPHPRRLSTTTTGRLPSAVAV